MHVADPLMMHFGMGKRGLHFKDSRFRYLATRGMALAVRRCLTGISPNRLGVALLVDIHRTSVNRWELHLAAVCMARRKAWHHDAQEKLYRQKKNRITLTASFDSHCIFTEETPPTRLSAEGRSCITSKQWPRILCCTSTRRLRGLTCARMFARRAPWRICTRRSTARHAACTPFLGRVFGNAQQNRTNPMT